MERILFLFFFTLISVLLDVYFSKVISKYSFFKKHITIKILYWSFTVITVINLIFYSLSINLDYYSKTILFNLVLGNFISKLVALPFLLIDDLRRILIYFFRNKSKKVNEGGIPRSKFLSLSASLAYGLPITTLTYGIISNNVYDYRVRKKEIYFDRLPKSFDGIKICHISDLHIGSLRNRLAATGGIDLISQQKADIIFFTGDLVNDKANELNGWGNDLGRIKAPLGVYSVLGNHDYGEYVSWKDNKEKTNNFSEILSAHKEFGWNLLMNQNTSVSVGSEKINILGVENWASSRFQQYGKLDLTYAGLGYDDFKILLSHNPSHWNAQVTNQYKDIDLTLSGHTHGLQYGIEIGDLRWSPSKFAYKQWADLYKLNNQQIYVNRGFGFLGYQGRVGILPEISILTLKRT